MTPIVIFSLSLSVLGALSPMLLILVYWIGRHKGFKVADEHNRVLRDMAHNAELKRLQEINAAIKATL